jgi:hypothetical protein
MTPEAHQDRTAVGSVKRRTLPQQKYILVRRGRIGGPGYTPALYTPAYTNYSHRKALPHKDLEGG